MSYTALYRKWRPERFDDVKGQDAIVTTLKNQVKNGRVGHAYLFCGTRGTGKTTVAKIFARTVNCENPVDGNPCGECATCRAIAAGASMNVIEFDAASNNGVDDVRRIIEEVQYSPPSGKYKVYIIDEVHMMSPSAFNALLKTLEEPPSYVIFIFATTDVHKLPVTVLSRCQRYDFKRISIDTITARLTELAQAEGIDVEDRALRYIAKSADGAMRDALSLLDQCVAFYMGKQLKYDDALEVLGAVDTEVFSRLLRRVIEADSLGCIKLLDEVLMQGRDLWQFATDFTWYLRNLLIVKTSPGGEEAVDMSSENLALLKEECSMADTDTIIRYIRIFSELAGAIKYSGQKRVLFEVALIKLTRPAMEQRQDYGDILGRLAMVEKRLDEGLVNVAFNVGAQGPAGGDAEPEMQKPDEPRKEVPMATRADLDRIVDGWSAFADKQRGRTTDSWASHAFGDSSASVSPDGSGLVIHAADEMCKGFIGGTSNGLKSTERLIEDEFGVHAQVVDVVAPKNPRDDMRSRMSVVENNINTEIIVDDGEEDI